MAGFFVLYIDDRRSWCNSDLVICAHLCPLRPLGDRPASFQEETSSWVPATGASLIVENIRKREVV
jgi:hypothetical protein